MMKTNTIKNAFRTAFATVVNSVTQFANSLAEIPGLLGIFEAAASSDWQTVSAELGEPIKNQRDLAAALTASATNKGLVANLVTIARNEKWALLSESTIDGQPVSVALIARLAKGGGAKPKRDPVKALDSAISKCSKLTGRARARAVLSLMDGLELLGVDVSNVNV